MICLTLDQVDNAPPRHGDAAGCLETIGDFVRSGLPVTGASFFATGACADYADSTDECSMHALMKKVNDAVYAPLWVCRNPNLDALILDDANYNSKHIPFCQHVYCPSVAFPLIPRLTKSSFVIIFCHDDMEGGGCTRAECDEYNARIGL